MIHTAPIEATNQLAALVSGSMLPLGEKSSRLKNSPTMSAGVASGRNSSWRMKKPIAV